MLKNVLQTGHGRRGSVRCTWVLALLTAAASGCAGGGGGGGTSQATAAPAATTTTAPATTSTPTTSTSPVTSPLPPVTAARLAVDTDRDGAITAADDAGRDTWTSARGAVFTYNNDDDGGRHALDCADTVIDGPHDSRSMGQILARQYKGVAPKTATITVAPTTAPVRIFRQDSAGKWGEFIPPGAGGSAQIPIADLAAGDDLMLIEATAPRSRAWDGTVTITLAIQDSTPSSDTVALRCAPIIFTDNTRPAQIVYAMKIDNPSGAPNLPFWNALATGLQAQGVKVSGADQSTYGFDRWVQDNMQIGYQGYAGSAGYAWLDEYNQLERGAGAGGGTPGGDLWSFAPDELLAPNQGYLYAGASTSQDSSNFGGNFEVMPSYDPSFPFGRVMHGGGDAGTVDGAKESRHMNPEEVELIEAQGAQAPTIEISSEWLAVGHLDEFLMAVPDLSGSGAHAFKVLWASPALARQALKALQTAGQGTAAVFAGHGTQSTVDAILNNAALMTYNAQVQARLDSDKAALMKACGLTAADFVELPVYYEISAYGGLNYALAQMPGVQNCIPVNDTLYVPDPAGPVDASGNDVWKTQVVNALAPYGLKVVFVDVFESYHVLMGEAHCASNVLYEPYHAPWWTR